MSKYSLPNSSVLELNFRIETKDFPQYIVLSNVEILSKIKKNISRSNNENSRICYSLYCK